MSRIARVVSEVDGTLLTHQKVLTAATRDAVRRLGEEASWAGIPGGDAR